MGGTSTQQQTQQSVSNPWEPAKPLLTGMLGQLQGQLGNTGLTPNESNALTSLENNGVSSSAQYAPQIGANATELLNGGGALNQAGAVNQNYQNYYNQTNPLASNLNYDPNQNPGTAGLLDQIRNDVGTSVNGMFAGAGRDLSGANQMAYGRGIAQGEAPVLFNQYNANRTAQQGAAGNLYQAGNTNAGLLSGMQQQALQNKQIGTGTASQAFDAQNQGNNSILQAEAARRGIPVQALGLLAQIGIPIAGLGGQTNGTSSGTQTDSGMRQFMQFGQGVGNIMGPIMKFSDRRLKEDIKQVGALFDGTPVYRYRYIGQPTFEIGVMAQDVEKVTPEAVGTIGQFKVVDYKLATDKALEAA